MIFVNSFECYVVGLGLGYVWVGSNGFWEGGCDCSWYRRFGEIGGFVG